MRHFATKQPGPGGMADYPATPVTWRRVSRVVMTAFCTKICAALSADGRQSGTLEATVVPTDMRFVPDRSPPGVGFRVHAPADDWSLLQASHPNVLVSGPRDATQACLLALTPSLQAPVHDGSACDALPTMRTGGSLILRDVDALDSEQQHQLLRWLNDPRNGQTQVISVTAAPLYAAVRTGTFLDPLYYRLNVVHFEVTPD